MDYHKFNQVLIPTTTSDIVFLLGRNDTALAFGMQLLTWVMMFSPCQFSETTKSMMFLSAEPTVYLYILPQGYINSALCHNIVCNDLDILTSTKYHSGLLYWLYYAIFI